MNKKPTAPEPSASAPLGDFQWVRETPEQTRFRNPLRLLFGSLFLLFLAGAMLLRARSDQTETHRSAFNSSPLLGARAGNSPSGNEPPGETQWRNANEQERSSAALVIRAQLNAFKRGDFEAAHALQSAGLRRNFPSADSLRRMIRQSYPHFTSARKTEFGRAEATEDSERVRIYLYLTSADGTQIQAGYHLVKEKGALRIDSVQGGSPPPSGRRKAPGPLPPSVLPDEPSVPNVPPNALSDIL
jgi:hypothetical protein